MVTEKRLIDANPLKEQIIKEIHYYWNNENGGYYLAEDVIPDIEDAPTVDAVEVVRCKDCKNWEDGYFGYCTKLHTAMDYDAFCSYGERRTAP